MLTTDDILRLFARENIALARQFLPDPYLGVYVRDIYTPTPLVLYHHRLESPSAESSLRVVLLEELSHHWTIKPYKLEGTHYTHAVCVGKNESAGKGLAANLAMPPCHVYRLIAAGWSVHQIAQRFAVTDAFANYQVERVTQRPDDALRSMNLVERILAHSKTLLARYKTHGLTRVG